MEMIFHKQAALLNVYCPVKVNIRFTDKRKIAAKNLSDSGLGPKYSRAGVEGLLALVNANSVGVVFSIGDNIIVKRYTAACGYDVTGQIGGACNVNYTMSP